MSINVDGLVTKCPKCGAEIPLIENYLTWCDSCNWNILPNDVKKKTDIFTKMVESISKKRGRAIYERTKQSLLQKNFKISFSELLSLIIALLVHILTLAFLVGGVLLIILGRQNILLVIYGVILLVFTWFLRPRFVKKATNIMSPNENPQFMKLIEEFSNRLNIKIQHVAINGNFNAQVSYVGIKQEKQLTIGLPLFTILDDQEVIALLAHEFSHFYNHDLTRSTIVSTALDSLKRWYYILYPGEIFRTDSLGAILTIPFRLFANLPIAFVWLTYYGLISLLFTNGQSAEYIADLKAATISGSNAFLGLLRKSKYSSCYFYSMKNCALRANEKLDLFDEIKRLINQMPERELKRIDRIEEINETRIDDSHPPTLFREKILAGANILPTLLSTQFDFKSIRAELSVYGGQIQDEVVDFYRERINYL